MAGEIILAVDDNETNLKLVKVLLTLENYQVYTAKNAADAIEILKTLDPAVILMDVQMPGMDGLELTRTLREDEKFKNTIIIAITAYAMKGDKEKTLDAGCNGYIAKPIDINTLPSIIAGFIENKKTSV